MPYDQKRINGPEVSFSFKSFIKKPESEETQGKIQKRADGRKFEESRQLAIQLNAISKAKGSCYIELGNTKIISAVFELRDIARSSKYADKGQLYCDFKFAPFSRENRKATTENEEKLMGNNIRSALESVVCLTEFPNYRVDVFVLVLEDDGSVLSGAITACGMACMDAGIPCYDMMASSTVAVMNGKMLIDPTADEEEKILNATTKALDNYGTITFSTLHAIEQISQILLNGFIDPEMVKKAKNRLQELNQTHVKYLRKVIGSKIAREVNEI